MAQKLHSLSSVLASKSKWGDKDKKDGEYHNDRISKLDKKDHLSGKQRDDIVREAEKGDRFHKKDQESFYGNVKRFEKKGKSAKASKKIAGSIFWKERAKAASKD